MTLKSLKKKRWTNGFGDWNEEVVCKVATFCDVDEELIYDMVIFVEDELGKSYTPYDFAKNFEKIYEKFAEDEEA